MPIRMGRSIAALGGVCRVGTDRLDPTAESGPDQCDPRVVPVGFHGELLRRTARRRRGAGLPEAAHGPALCALPDRGERRHAQEPGACRCRASRPTAGRGRRAPRARRIDRARADHTPLRGRRSLATAGAKSGFGAAAAKTARGAAGHSCAREDRRHRTAGAAGTTGIATNLARTDSAAAAARPVDDPAGLRGGTAGLLRDRAGGRRPHRRLPRRQWRVVVGGMPAGDPVGAVTT